MIPGKEKRAETVGRRSGMGINRRLPQVPTGDFVDNMSGMRGVKFSVMDVWRTDGGVGTARVCSLITLIKDIIRIHVQKNRWVVNPVTGPYTCYVMSSQRGPNQNVYNSVLHVYL